MFFMKRELLNYLLIAGISLTMVVPNIRSLDQMIPEFIYYGILTTISLGYISFVGIGLDQTKLLVSHPLTIAVLIFFSLSIIGLFFAVNQSESIIALSKYFIIIVSVYVLSILMKNLSLQAFLILIISLLFLETSKVIYEFTKIYNFQSPLIRSRNYAGFAANVNVMAFSILFKLPFLVSILNKQKLSSFKNILLILLLSGSVFSIMISFSRGAILASILSMILYICFFIFFKYKDIKHWYKRIGVILLTIIITSATYSFLFQNAKASNISNRITSFDLVDTTSSINFRMTYYKNAIQAMFDQPLLGYGIGNWKVVSIKYAKDFIQAYEVPYHAHNDFLQIGAETGIIGFLSYLFIFLFLLYKLIWSILSNRVNQNKKEFYLAFFLCVLIYSLDSSINFPRARPVNIINLTLVIGFLISKNFKLESHENI